MKVKAFLPWLNEEVEIELTPEQSAYIEQNTVTELSVYGTTQDC